MMTLRKFAKEMGITYRTAWRWWNAGDLNALQTRTGSIFVECEEGGDVRDGLKNKGKKIQSNEPKTDEGE